jgi:Thiol-disulfide isomerase and thioredoxins
MHDAPARPRRWRTATRVGTGLALVAAFAAAVYLSTLPLGRAGAASPLSSSGFFPIGSAVDGFQVGQPAPEFSAADGGAPLLDLDGRPIRLADFADRPLWIVFWATWCTPCQQEAPDIRAAFHAHEGDNLAVLAIDLWEPASAVRDYARGHDLDYVIGLDPAAVVLDLYRARGLPTHFFLDGAGVIRARYSGQLTSELMEQYLAVITGG